MLWLPPALPKGEERTTPNTHSPFVTNLKCAQAKMHCWHACPGGLCLARLRAEEPRTPHAHHHQHLYAPATPAAFLMLTDTSCSRVMHLHMAYTPQEVQRATLIPAEQMLCEPCASQHTRLVMQQKAQQDMCAPPSQQQLSLRTAARRHSEA